MNLLPHSCPKFPDEPFDEVWVERGKRCIYCGWRAIRPHKGGRTERIYIRASPETRARLKEIKQRTGKTAGDLLEEKTEETMNRIEWIEKLNSEALALQSAGQAAEDAITTVAANNYLVEIDRDNDTILYRTPDGTLINAWLEGPQSGQIEPGGAGFDDYIEWFDKLEEKYPYYLMYVRYDGSEGGVVGKYTSAPPGYPIYFASEAEAEAWIERVYKFFADGSDGEDIRPYAEITVARLR